MRTWKPVSRVSAGGSRVCWASRASGTAEILEGRGREQRVFELRGETEREGLGLGNELLGIERREKVIDREEKETAMAREREEMLSETRGLSLS